MITWKHVTHLAPLKHPLTTWTHVTLALQLHLTVTWEHVTHLAPLEHLLSTRECVMLALQLHPMRTWEDVKHLAQLKHHTISIMCVSLAALGTPPQKSLTCKELPVLHVQTIFDSECSSGYADDYTRKCVADCDTDPIVLFKDTTRKKCV